VLDVRRSRSPDLRGVQLAWRDQASEARRRLRAALWPAVQAAVAAGLAWLLAHDALGHAQPRAPDAAYALRPRRETASTITAASSTSAVIMNWMSADRLSRPMPL